MYQLIRGSDSIRRLGDGACIPRDPANRDYGAVLAWLEEGNTLLPEEPAPLPTQDQLDAEEAAAYPKLRALTSMTPAQIGAWVDANVTTDAARTDAIKTLAIAVGIFARRLRG